MHFSNRAIKLVDRLGFQFKGKPDWIYVRMNEYSAMNKEPKYFINYKYWS
jgi:hypothetical protein